MRARPISLAAAAAALACIAAPLALAAPTDGDPRRVVLSAMRAELERSMAKLRLPGYEAPYFIEFAVRDEDHEELVGRLGAIYGDSRKHERHAYVDVRVGDYDLDNTSDDDDPVFDLDAPEGYTPSSQAPLDDDPAALRGTLWLLADGKYKRALAGYARKRGKRASMVSENEGLPSLSREKAVEAVEPAAARPFDHAREAERARRASALFKRWPEIFESSVRINVERVTRYLVNSEGSAVITSRTIYGAYLAAATRAKDGMLLEHEKSFYAASPDELPDDLGLARSAEELAGELRALREAAVVDPYTGPAILMPQAAGVFFHEAVGHRLEGERQNNEKEGRTFKGQIGQRILPEFLSVHDDPTRRRVDEGSGDKVKPVSLNGYYRYDDEGVPARDVTLIDRGVLRDYLMSRSPIRGSLHSNGHGRAEGTGDPMGRMANLIVSSSRKVGEAELKKMLLDEVRRQGKPFGLVIRDITGGATNTSNYGFQAFKGQPRLVYRIDAKTGAETLVRGVEMVGTPLASINKIVATSDTVGVFNGFCGAESGFVPVSTVAPAVLFSEIELQRSERALERPQVLPAPWK